MASRIDLLRQRQRLGRLGELRDLAAGLGYAGMADYVDRDRAALSGTVLWIEVPCLGATCRTLHPVPAQVGDPERTMPSAVLCNACALRLDALIEGGG